tara:strand:+ start:1315 stop:1566 length:252 start_codon:yes stop_codon:yes gene_type:complete
MANWTMTNVKLHVNHLVEGIAQVGPLVHKGGHLNNQAVLVAVAEEAEEAEEAAHKGLVWFQNLTKTGMESSTKPNALKPVNSF